MSRVVVVGGGISGLVAALRLSQDPAVAVTVLEASEALGGKISTVPLEGAIVELGADSFLPRDDAPLQLCRDIGILDELVEPSDFGGWVALRGRLKRLPRGTVLGFPASVRTIATTNVLSVRGKLRAAAELLHRRPLEGPDVPVAGFTRRRLGHEVLERLVDPLLSGTRAGDVDEMSLAAALPAVDAAARSHRSVTRGLARQRDGAALAPRFFAPRSGMRTLIDALAASIRGDIRLSAPVEQIRAISSGIAVDLAGETLEADGAIVATPAHRSAELVRPLSQQAAWHLGQIPHVSAAVVNLVFAPGSVETPRGGSGILVPSKENMTISGCTWFSSKWPALAAPDGGITIRCFVGRARREPALDLDDRDLEGVVVEELARLIPISGGPDAAVTTRWERGLPAYRVGHRDRVNRIEELLETAPGVALTGASYRGSGIPDCIAQAERAVARLLRRLRR